jgi:TIR domain
MKGRDPSRPGVFISHSHVDKPFARRLTIDLAALGAHVWLDEAEMRIGDSLFDKIQQAIDDVDFLAVVLSPESVKSAWVNEEVKQAMAAQLAGAKPHVLPLLLREAVLPGFLREKLYADFREEITYEVSLGRVAETIGLRLNEPRGATIRDPFASKYGRIEEVYARPSVWHCVFCGWRCNVSYDNYFCQQCHGIRPFFAPGATMIQCRLCSGWSIGIAKILRVVW